MMGPESKDRLQQLTQDLQQLQSELAATQTRLRQLTQQVQDLQQQADPSGPVNFFKTPYPPQFSAENFIGLRLIHLIGIVVLVIGLSIGVKYAIDKQLISEQARIALAYAAGGLLYILSWRLRKYYAAFSAILFSGALASLYFTSYAAFVYYSLFPFAIVFVLMVLLTVFTVYQALAYNRQEIAMLGLVGAYAILFLISSNSGRAELLFTYVAVINLAVVFLAFKKNWYRVAALAQLVTWVLLTGWALSQFTSSQQGIAYFFTGFFFLLFTAYALSGAVVQKQALVRWQLQQLLITEVWLYVLIFIVYSASVSLNHLGPLQSGFAVFFALQALAVHSFLPREIYLKKCLALLSLLCVLLFIAGRWEGFTVTLLWLLLAVVIFAAGFRLKAVWLRLSAMVLMGLTLAKLLLLDSLRFSTLQKIIAYLTLGVLLLVIGYFYQRFKEKLFHNEAGAT